MSISFDLSFNLDLRHPDTGEVIELRDYQSKAFDDPSKRKIYWWPRRNGKSLLAAVEAVQWALSPSEWPNKETSTILIITPRKQQLEVVFDKVRGICRQSGLSHLVSRNVRGHPQRVVLTYPGGSSCTIVGFASSSTGLRPCGQDADLVIVDEADWVSEDFVLGIVHPIILTRSSTKLIIFGTPRKDEDSYMHRCAKTGDYVLCRSTVMDRPGIDEIIDQLREQYPPELFEEECMVPLSD